MISCDTSWNFVVVMISDDFVEDCFVVILSCDVVRDSVVVVMVSCDVVGDGVVVGKMIFFDVVGDCVGVL